VGGLRLDRARIRTLFDLSSEVYASRGGAFAEDPYPVFHRLRETGPVHPGAPHEALGWTGDVFFQGLPYPQRAHFSAYDYETCATVLKDDRRFVTKVDTLPDEQPFPDAAILYMNGREHRDYRTLVQPSFVPARAVWWLDHFVHGMVGELIDGFADERAVDLNLEYCSAIPMLTITGSLGIGVEDALDVREYVTSDLAGGQVLARLLFPIIAARREAPADDLISVLVAAELTIGDGTVRRLDDVEIIAFCFLLLAAGSGTTWKQMGITLNALLAHPIALAAVRDGAIVHVCLAAANRDPARWERPDEFDPFRPMKPNLGFGHGPHTCLGMHVARTEMVYGIAALLERFPELRLDPDAPSPRVIGLYERGADAVPVLLR
jgi:cytochrome P450